MSWTNGYATEIEYVNDFNRALNPSWIDFCLTLAGIETRESLGGERNLRYLELGFGLGNSLILNAVTRDGEFVGNDFIPAHLYYAKKNAKQANLKISDESFKQIKKRLKREKCKFDYIVLHGVWSWISTKNQKVILEIIKDCLEVGGVVYISYNCYPGWDGKVALRHLLKLYEMGVVGSKEQRIKQSLAFGQEFFATHPAYIQQNPLAFNMQEELQKSTINYLSHEFFNEDWHCCYFSDMAHLLQECKCTFAGSAKLTWYFDELTFNADEKALLQSVSEPILKEQLKDYFLNELFRMDIFIKGNHRLSKQERLDKLLSMGFALVKSPAYFLAPQGGVGEICTKILKCFTDDSYRPQTLRAIAESTAYDGEMLLPMICAMMTQGILHPIQNAPSEEICARVKDYNKHLFECNNRSFLASSLIGGGIHTDEVIWLCLKGFMEGLRDVQSLLHFVSKEYSKKSQKENLELEIAEFLKSHALYQALGILEYS